LRSSPRGLVWRILGRSGAPILQWGFAACHSKHLGISHSFLHRVVDVDSAVPEVVELGAARVPGIQS